MTFSLTLAEVLAYNQRVKKPRVSSYISRICHGLYLSDWDSAMNLGYLVKRKIKAVVTVNLDAVPVSVLDGYMRNGIAHLYITSTDYTDSELNKDFETCYRFILRHIKKGGVLVHCTMGISRSPTIVADFLIRYLYQHDTDIERYLTERKAYMGKIPSKEELKGHLEAPWIGLFNPVYTFVQKKRREVWPIMTFIKYLMVDELLVRSEWLSAREFLRFSHLPSPEDNS